MPFRHVSRSPRRLLTTGLTTVSAIALLVPLAPDPDGVPFLDDPSTSVTAAARADAPLPSDASVRRAEASLVARFPGAGDLRPFVEEPVVVAAAETIEPAPEPEPASESASEEPEPEPTETEEAEESDCPENSSPDCAYTYRHAISTWEALADCESGGDWSTDTGNGYYGGVQFSLSSWESVGGSGYPHEHSKWTQIHYAEELQASQGWNAWPACADKLGLR